MSSILAYEEVFSGWRSPLIPLWGRCTEQWITRGSRAPDGTIPCMDSARGRNLPLVIGGVLVLVVVAAAYFFFAPNEVSVPVSEQVPQIDSGPDVAAQVSGAVETPADKLPETNPFSDYKNPFE